MSWPQDRGPFFWQDMQTQVTKDGLEALQVELHELKANKRPALVERLSNARKDGDLSENNDYQTAREELEFLDGRISELEEVIKNAKIVTTACKKGTIDVGARVVLKIKGKEFEYHIVGEWEADPVAKKISLTSPLGCALSGKKVGDKVAVEAPAGIILYDILSID